MILEVTPVPLGPMTRYASPCRRNPPEPPSASVLCDGLRFISALASADTLSRIRNPPSSSASSSPIQKSPEPEYSPPIHASSKKAFLFPLSSLHPFFNFHLHVSKRGMLLSVRLALGFSLSRAESFSGD